MIEMLLDKYTLSSELFPTEFGGLVRTDEPLKRYTAARLGGRADILIEVTSSNMLRMVIERLWQLNLDFTILGSGSNVLVSDAGVRGIVVINKTRGSGKIRFDIDSSSPSVWAESGVSLVSIARQASRRGLSGLEWATGIPGTLGGAVVGNAGAHGQDIAGIFVMAEILQLSENTIRSAQTATWFAEQMDFCYRGSVLKGRSRKAILLNTTLHFSASKVQAVKVKVDEFTRYRRVTQPQGASLGSIFKNPASDYAGRLVEEAGLKGVRIGDAMISPVHANFIINNGKATAADYFALIQLAKKRVFEKSGLHLELEIELLGDFDGGLQ